MKRGEIYYAELDPAMGGETKKRRPVLVVSNNANNKVATTLTIVPITSNIRKIYPFEVLLGPENTGLPKKSKAQCHQIRTISKNRIKKFIPLGKANSSIMRHIQMALAIHLGFETNR